jgi:hypothetical protein
LTSVFSCHKGLVILLSNSFSHREIHHSTVTPCLIPSNRSKTASNLRKGRHCSHCDSSDFTSHHVRLTCFVPLYFHAFFRQSVKGELILEKSCLSVCQPVSFRNYLTDFH